MKIDNEIQAAQLLNCAQRCSEIFKVINCFALYSTPYHAIYMKFLFIKSIEVRTMWFPEVSPVRLNSESKLVI
ncbi:hypothetical protein DTW90_28835 [Neorhizobium sp. P12A]|nr:hypothetical protein DTW90_28835 [Neorhizobium sp. P12A]